MSNQSVCCESSGLARQGLYKRTCNDRSGAAYRIDRAESEAFCVGTKAERVNGAISHATCNVVSCSPPTEAALEWHVSLQGRDPPIHVLPPFTCASGPGMGQLPAHSLASLRLSALSVRRLARCPVHAPATRSGIRSSVDIYSNHVSRDRRIWV